MQNNTNDINVNFIERQNKLGKFFNQNTDTKVLKRLKIISEYNNDDPGYINFKNIFYFDMLNVT